MGDEQAKDVQEEERSATRKLIDQKSVQIKGDLKDMVRNDLIGVDQWKRSKIGALTGFSLVSDSVGRMFSSFSQSSTRLSNLFDAVTAPEQTPAAPLEGSPQDKFEAGVKFYGLSETQVAIALRNTFWSTVLYAVIGVVFCGMVVWSFYQWPVNDAVTAISRLGPLPLIVALLFKHSYTNWIFRKRHLGGSAWPFLSSGDYLPRMR